MKLLSLAPFAVSLMAASAWAAPPATETAQGSSYNARIVAIGNGTLDVHVLRGPSGIIHPVNADDQTAVTLLDGSKGKLADLKVGQWAQLTWVADPNDPKQQRIVKIEPGMSPWARSRLADLQKASAAVEVSLIANLDGKGDVEELHLLGPEAKGAYKEPFAAGLSEEEMDKLLNYLALEGFLGEMLDGKAMDGKLAQPKPPFVKLSAGGFFLWAPLTPDLLKRLQGVALVLPDWAGGKSRSPADKWRGLLARIAPKATPATQPGH